MSTKEYRKNELEAWLWQIMHMPIKISSKKIAFFFKNYFCNLFCVCNWMIQSPFHFAWMGLSTWFWCSVLSTMVVRIIPFLFVSRFLHRCLVKVTKFRYWLYTKFHDFNSSGNWQKYWKNTIKFAGEKRCMMSRRI